jgi:hypothetical protein
MASSSAKTVAEYLAELPAERRKVIAAVRKAIRANLPKGYAERMNWGMIAYEVPLKRFADTYNGQPLLYLALAAQKNNYALYSMCVYGSPVLLKWLKEEFKKAGRRLDMGKSCIRFKDLDGMPLEVVGRLAAQVPVDRYIEYYESVKKPKKK